MGEYQDIRRSEPSTYRGYTVLLQSTCSLSKFKGPVFSFEATEFCYEGGNICAILGENTHFDQSGHFVIT